MGRKNRKLTPLEGLTLLLTALFAAGTLGWFAYTGRAGEAPTLAAVQRPGGGGGQEVRADAPGMLEGEVLDLNTAPQGDLTRLPGIGESRAAAIVAWREAHGGFRSAEEVQAVSGIGPETYARIQPYVTVTPQGGKGEGYGADLGG